MKFTVVIACDTSAFEDRNGAVADILVDLAKHVRAGDLDNNIGRTQYRTLQDADGNLIGHATFDRTGESGYPREVLPDRHWRWK